MGLAGLFIKGAEKGLMKSSKKSSGSKIASSLGSIGSTTAIVAKDATGLAFAGMHQIYVLGGGALTLLFFLLR